MNKTRNFIEVLQNQLAKNAMLAEAVDLECLNADIAAQIIDCRKEAKLTQQQLADLVGTHQSVIARLEDADYDGHSLTMLQRIARALGKKLHVDFCARPVYEPVGTAEATTSLCVAESADYEYQIEINYAQ